MRATVILAVLLVLTVSAACSAAPAVRGYTGVIMTPNTEVVGQHALDIAAHTFDVDNLGGVPNLDASSTTFAATVGIIEGLEATVAVRALDMGVLIVGPGGPPGGVPQLEDEQIGLHLKYQVLGEPDDSLGLAVGVTDVFEQWDDFMGMGSIGPLSLSSADIGFYGVVSKNFSDLEAGDPPLRLNVGVLLSESPLFADSLSQVVPFLGDDLQLFGSVEAGLSDEVTLALELAGDSINYGVQASPVPELNIDVGLLEAFGSTEFYWGGSYGFTW